MPGYGYKQHMLVLAPLQYLKCLGSLTIFWMTLDMMHECLVKNHCLANHRQLSIYDVFIQISPCTNSLFNLLTFCLNLNSMSMHVLPSKYLIENTLLQRKALYLGYIAFLAYFPHNRVERK